MKSAIPASALSVLFYPSQVLSAQTLHAVSVETNREETWAKKSKVQAENEKKLVWERKSLDLKRTVKAKLDIRTKVGHDDWHLGTTGDECTPFKYVHENNATKKYERDVDVGILRGCDNPDHYCIGDTQSSLGGICARVKTADEHVKVVDKLGSMVNVHEVRELKPANEDKADGTDSTTTKSTRTLKMVTVKDKLRAMYILEQNKAGGGEYSNLIGEECEVGNNPGFVDVGILDGCKHVGHICIEEPSSSLGGLCVDIGADVDKVIDSFQSFSPNGVSRLVACTYSNGTSGEKCAGSRACDGLSGSFISSNIGCGSCNSYGACSGLTG